MLAEYKRKKIPKSHKKFRSKHYIADNNDIIMSNSKVARKNIIPESDIKVVRGSKLKRKRRLGIFSSIVALLCLICLILSLTLPTGLYESAVNAVSLIGNGSYPVQSHGSTVLSAVSNGSYYYVLSDTNISAFSNNGKQIFSELHGFSNPVMSVSDTRALIYDQGGKALQIYNLSGKIHTLETDYEIITASISKKGDFAISTQSNNYTSAVTVYNKKYKQIYKWNSAKDIVNNVLVNPSGDKIAVSTINAVSGQFDSKVIILDFKSADALYTLDLKNSVAISMQNTGKGFSIVTEDKYRYINWSKFNSNEISASGEINVFRTSNNGVLLVFNRANDRSDNTVVLISNSGTKIAEFKINNIITDIRYSKSRIYYISDTAVNILDKNGTLLRAGDCAYGAKCFSVIGSNSLAIVTDNEIIKTVIEKGE